jgi:hypothetical protein
VTDSKAHTNRKEKEKRRGKKQAHLRQHFINGGNNTQAKGKSE